MRQQTSSLLVCAPSGRFLALPPEQQQQRMAELQQRAAGSFEQ